MVDHRPKRMRCSTPALRLRRSALATMVAVAAVACACTPSAADSSGPGLYVAPDGSDSAPGTALRPLKTIQRAVDRAHAGTTIYLFGGEYDGFRMTRSGRRRAPIRITAESPSSNVVVRYAGTGSDVIHLSRVHDIVLERMTVTGAPNQFGAGLRIDASHGIRVTRMKLLHNRSYGIKIKDSTFVRVTHSRMTKNETGIEVSGLGRGVLIADNDIYRNDRLIVNDPAPNNDRGANGTGFFKTTGHVRVTRNRIWGNRGPSHDWVHDGGAFEIYGASNLDINHNVVWDNENITETGTDRSAPCDHNRFYRNVAYAGGSLPSGGMILRCASNMLVANNTIVGIDRFAFDVKANDSRYGGSVAGLRIVNNVASSPDRVYSIDSALPASVKIDHNLAFNPTGGWLAYVFGHGNTRKLPVFAKWSGFDRGGVAGNPRFRNPGRRDYRLRSNSPALNRGLPVRGVTSGPKPDLGRWEMG